ncbi:MAG TPA: uracil-DNA glycosylase, partial [Edaphobacter sp.]|nr:uracil-DNA glycosylase [Edaphobacter sp.]
MAADAEQRLRAYVEYFRDLGIHDFYRRGEPVAIEAAEATVVAILPSPEPPPPVVPEPASVPAAAPLHYHLEESAIPKLVSFNDLAPLPRVRIAVPERAGALQAIRDEIGDCTRCPLAYAGRRNIVFGEGNPAARLMFVGEGPGADEDAS